MNSIQRNLKLLELSQAEGFEDVPALLEQNIIDSVVPGICTSEGCSYTVGVEPDQSKGWCEECGKNTVQSCMVLARII